MRRLLVLALLVPALSFAQDAPFGPRLGSTIDAYERSYFGLFPDDDEFDEAALMLDEEGIRVTFRREGQRDVVRRYDRQVGLAVEQVIDVYEDTELSSDLFVRNARFTQELREVLSPVRELTGDPSTIALRTSRPRQGVIQGEVLFASPEYAYVWTGTGPYDWRSLGEVEAVGIAEIEGVGSPGRVNGSLGRGALAAVLAGGGSAGALQFSEGSGRRVDAPYIAVAAGQAIAALVPAVAGLQPSLPVADSRLIRQSLARRQTYSEMPPELRSLRDETPLEFDEEVLDVPETIRAPEPRFRIGITASGRMQSRDADPDGRYRSNPNLFNRLGFTEGSVRRYALDASYRVIPRVRVGLDAGVARPASPPAWSTYESTSSALGYVEVDMIAPSVSPIQVSIGAGGGFVQRTLSMDTEFSPEMQGLLAGGGVRPTYSADAAGLSGMGRVGIGYRSGPMVTVRLLGTVRTMPPVTLPALQVRDVREFVAFEWDDIEGTNMYFDLSVGTLLSF